VTRVAALLEPFFTERLHHQRNASPNTVVAYRDTFRLLLTFAQERLRTPPSALLLTQIDADFIAAFLRHLEKQRKNSVRTRNARLAAIHSFFRYVILQEPGYSATCQRVLAIPTKRSQRKLVTSLTRAEQEALLRAPGRTTWLGRRDYAIITLLLQTGLRVSELCDVRCEDVVLARGAHVRCRGKGRKERCTPLTRETTAVLRAWLAERAGSPTDVAFPSRRGDTLSRDAIERLLSKHAKTGSTSCPSLQSKRVTPHVLRHTTAVSLLQAGCDRSVIALWLGHESIETTQMYLDADLEMKERALAKTTPLRASPGRYRPDDALLAFLNGL
jgi:site-specific recombinase XerD